MDELQISGKRYISSRRAAQEHGYHADYIGQLVRGGKVAGQKVGRSWYVDAASLLAHLGSEGAQKEVEIADEKKKEVEPVVLKKEESSMQKKEHEEKKEEITKTPVEAEAPEEVIPPLVAEEAVAEKKEGPVFVEAVSLEPAEEEKAVVVLEKEEHPIVVRKERVAMPEMKTTPRGGLRYVTDDTPSLPPLKISENSFSPVEEEVSFSEISVRSSSLVGRVASLAFLGILSFGIFFGFSYGLTEVAALAGESMTSSIIFSIPY